MAGAETTGTGEDRIGLPAGATVVAAAEVGARVDANRARNCFCCCSRILVRNWGVMTERDDTSLFAPAEEMLDSDRESELSLIRRRFEDRSTVCAMMLSSLSVVLLVCSRRWVGFEIRARN